MSPRPQQPPEQAEAKKSAIIQATLDAIVARGPADVRLGDVAKAVGMSIGTVQYYFESRDELLAQAFSIHTATVLMGIAEIAKPRDDDRGRSARYQTSRCQPGMRVCADGRLGPHSIHSRAMIATSSLNSRLLGHGRTEREGYLVGRLL
jgi:AcrR family transcriptional regulator